MKWSHFLLVATVLTTSGAQGWAQTGDGSGETSSFVVAPELEFMALYSEGYNRYIFSEGDDLFLFARELEQSEIEKLLETLPGDHCWHNQDTWYDEDETVSLTAAGLDLAGPTAAFLVGPGGPISCVVEEGIVRANLSGDFDELSITYPLSECQVESFPGVAPVAVVSEQAPPLRWIPAEEVELALDENGYWSDAVAATVCPFGSRTIRSQAVWREWLRRADMGWAHLRWRGHIQRAATAIESVEDIFCEVLWEGHGLDLDCLPSVDAVFDANAARGLRSGEDWTAITPAYFHASFSVLADGDRIQFVVGYRYENVYLQRRVGPTSFSLVSVESINVHWEGPSEWPALDPYCGY